MESHSSQFIYQPLPPIAPVGKTPPFTRLFLFNSGQANEPLRGTLVIHALDPSYASIPPYEALSYVWGSGSAQTPIYINDCPIVIKPNLDAALRSLRPPTQARLLWVDALCIDQSNADERSRQVGYMRLVYKHATRVIVWLGSWTPGVEMAFELAERLAHMRDSCGADKDTLQKAVVELAVGAPEAFHHLDQLFDRPYFIRNWCIQEVVASRRAIAKCEGLEMNFFDLISTAPYVAMKRDQILVGMPFEFWNMIFLLQHPSSGSRGGAVEGSLGNLTLLLASSRDFKVTDPRDKVFSLLGISDEGLDPSLALTQIMSTSGTNTVLSLYRRAASSIARHINDLGPGLDILRHKALQPNYNKDVVEVYRDLTRFLIRKSPRVLSVLAHVQHTDDPAQSYFPSWVPKWFQPRQCSVLDVGCFLAGFCDGHFRYFAEVEDMPLSKEPMQPNYLRLRGFHVDKVKSVSEILEYSLTGPFPFQDLWNQMFSFPINQSPMPLYHDKAPLVMAFCATLLATPLGAAMGDISQLMGETQGLTKEKFIRQGEADAAVFLLSKILVDDTIPIACGPEKLNLLDYLCSLVTMELGEAGADAERFERGARSVCFHRRFYVTEKGYLGIGPRMMSPGDEVCVLFGGRVPFILRRMPDHHLFIGDTYINDDDVMWGKITEGIKHHKKSDIPSFLYEMR
ncbi:HET domain-containing protein [Paracoccidioides lutzii Pb01]|uniref:HET domain-containing protein n=1 Tax=Paracoccidioides lutzii (strain ATCC MYA-826 / Pb01) TaxID=502779 RepID=C1HC28_PARBA|nr:HET domain-containing protein [Paracoccidioides lutzii Pb01]EEH38592.1 HET domain-containing protein [Paracoccidioides lutzii Pb01]